MSDLRSGINGPLPKTHEAWQKMEEVPQDGSNADTYFYPFLKAFQTLFLGLIVTKWSLLSLVFRISRLLETLSFYGVRLIHLNMDLGSSSHFPKYEKLIFRSLCSPSVGMYGSIVGNGMIISV